MLNPNQQQESIEAEEESAEGTRTQFPTIIHPADLGSSKQDVIRFDMHEYVPGELSQVILEFRSTERIGIQ